MKIGSTKDFIEWVKKERPEIMEMTWEEFDKFTEPMTPDTAKCYAMWVALQKQKKQDENVQIMSTFPKA